MNTTYYRESAKIYEFPTRARATVAAYREDAAPVVNLTTPRVPKASFGSGWYHDAAIQEAERTAKR